MLSGKPRRAEPLTAEDAFLPGIPGGRPVSKKVDVLIAERRKLRAAYKANRAEQIQLQIKLDKVTSALVRAVGLEALLDFGCERRKE